MNPVINRLPHPSEDIVYYCGVPMLVNSESESTLTLINYIGIIKQFPKEGFIYNKGSWHVRLDYI
jgi:hypothetical protein